MNYTQKLCELPAADLQNSLFQLFSKNLFWTKNTTDDHRNRIALITLLLQIKTKIPLKGFRLLQISVVCESSYCSAGPQSRNILRSISHRRSFIKGSVTTIQKSE